MKRAFDITFSIILLIALAPLMLVISVAIICVMGRPVVFQQLRPGRDERLFRLYKFRRMKCDRGPDGKPPSDTDRLTRLGCFLRGCSLDELPELFNVLRGDMSLVGPRPLLPKYLPYYAPHERLRHSVRPGMTGWAQIHGRNGASWDQRRSNDVWYCEHSGFWLDMKILCLTVMVVFGRRGIVVDPGSVMRDLDEERSSCSA